MLVFSNEISNYQIEGISIGDSALEHVSEDLVISEIKRISEHYKYLNNPDKFGEVYRMGTLIHILIFLYLLNEMMKFIKFL